MIAVARIITSPRVAPHAGMVSGLRCSCVTTQASCSQRNVIRNVTMASVQAPVCEIRSRIHNGILFPGLVVVLVQDIIVRGK